MLKKENGHSFPKLDLKIMRKTLHFHFSHVSELNFHNCSIIDNEQLTAALRAIHRNISSQTSSQKSKKKQS